MKKRIPFCLGLLAFFFLHLPTGISQQNDPSHCGKAVLTCFSGDRTGSTPGGPTFVMYDVRDRSAITPSLADQSGSFNKTMFPNWIASNTGEVFGTAIDRNELFYLTATSIYTFDYRGDPVLGNTGGEVYQVNPTTGAINLLVRLPNSGQGLGNVCYAHAPNGQDLLFVTNFDDGKIYRIDLSNPASFTTFDPFLPDDPAESFAPIGELLWGIAWHPAENQLYFGRWMQNGGDLGSPNNCSTCNTTPGPDADIGLGANEVHSLPLDADGDFIGGSSTQLEITLPLIHQVGGITGSLISNPVSDIAVSSEGRMLVTEKPMCCPTESGAHRGSVVEYEKTAGTWAPVPGKQFIIGGGSGSNLPHNSAGGVDYGYDSFDPMNLDSIPPCDSMIWVTCDVFNLPVVGNIGYYGMVGIPTTGNDYHPNLNSIFIDAAPGSDLQKRFIGDVEIFDCGCPSTSASFCYNFNDKTPGSASLNLDNWSATFGTVQYSSSMSQGGSADVYLIGNDLGTPPGSTYGSIIFNQLDYQGNWITEGNEDCFCYDFIVITNGTGIPNTPNSLQIYQGAVHPQDAPLRAVFQTTVALQEGDGWATICPPISLANPDGSLPSNAHGQWVMAAGTDADWNNLITNVGGIAFALDIPNGGPTEIYGYDNICLEDCPQFPSECEIELLSVEAAPTDLQNNNCCHALNYEIDNPNAAAVTITALDGAHLEYDPTTGIHPSLQRVGWSLNSVTLLNEAGGFLPQGILSDFFTFCLTHRSVSPQQVLIEWKDAQGNLICDEILEFDCPVEPDCLYILEEELVCNEAGYQYTITVKNPLGSAIAVGLVKLNVSSPTGITIEPSHIVDLSADPILPGETRELTFILNTNGQNFAGQEFCFLLSAHDGPDETLCCAEIEVCHTLPECNPCDYIGAEVVPQAGTTPEACCYDLLLTNNWGESYFTAVETEILTPGVTFSTFYYDWFSAWNASEIDPNRHYRWTHDAGFIPSMTGEYLMNFCLAGVTSTSPVEIEISWIAGDTICMDTLLVSCPECLTVVEDNVRCLEDGSYEYSFSFQNLNDGGYPVTAVEIVDLATGINVLPDGLIQLTSPLPYGGTSETIVLTIPAGAGPPPGSADPVEFCFKITLHNQLDDGTNIECCSIIHCIELTPCETDEPCVLQCPRTAPIAVGCHELPPDFDPEDIAQLQLFFGLLEPVGDCPYEILELPPTVNLDDCGGGNILRQFQVIDANGNQFICNRSITIEPTNSYEMGFPADIVVDCTEAIPDTFLLAGSLCDDLAVSITETDVEPNGAGCFQVLRTYSVINWCEYDGQSNPVVVSRDADCDGQFGEEFLWVLVRPEATYYDQDNEEGNLNPALSPCGNGAAGHLDNSSINPSITSTGYWQYTQIITVVDNAAPIVTVNAEEEYCVRNEQTCLESIKIGFTVEENCPQDNLTVDVFLDLDITDSNQNGGIDLGDFLPDHHQSSGVFAVLNNFPDFTIDAPDLPIGRHAFLIHAEDFCGNPTAVLVPFTMLDCTVDPPACNDMISRALVPLPAPIDIDQDGDPDVAFSTLTLTQVATVTLAEGCSGPLTYSINVEGQAPNINQTALIFTCEDLGNVNVEVYAWSNGAPQGSCWSTVTVTDPQNLCPDVNTGDQTAEISLYPNPGDTEVYLNVKPFIGRAAGVSIYNRLGQIVQTYRYDEIGRPAERLDVSGLEDGLYFVEIRIAGRETEVKKLVVSR